MARGRLDYALRAQLPKQLGLALEREAERRMLSLSALVRVELARAMGLIDETGKKRQPEIGTKDVVGGGAT